PPQLRRDPIQGFSLAGGLPDVVEPRGRLLAAGTRGDRHVEARRRGRTNARGALRHARQRGTAALLRCHRQRGGEVRPTKAPRPLTPGKRGAEGDHCPRRRIAAGPQGRCRPPPRRTSSRGPPPRCRPPSTPSAPAPSRPSAPNATPPPRTRSSPPASPPR